MTVRNSGHWKNAAVWLITMPDKNFIQAVYTEGESTELPQVHFDDLECSE